MVYGSLVPAIKELWTTASRHKRAETKKGPRMEGLSLYCVVSYRLAELVDYETGTQLGLKPSGLGGHDVAGVGNVDNLFHADGIEGEGDLHFAVVHTTFQLAEATDAADEVDAFVGAEVFDAEHLVEDEVAEDGDVEHTDGVIVVVGAGLGSHFVPVAVGQPLERGVYPAKAESLLHHLMVGEALAFGLTRTVGCHPAVGGHGVVCL